MSQQASAVWFEFCVEFRVSPAAEMANAAAQAKLIKSTLIFLIYGFSKLRIARAIQKEGLDGSVHTATRTWLRQTSKSRKHKAAGEFALDQANPTRKIGTTQPDCRVEL